MKFHIATPAKVLLFSLVLILQFSCSKDSDLLAEQISIDPEVAIGKFVKNDNFQIRTSNNAPENNESAEETIEISVSDESGTILNNDSYEVNSKDGIELDVLANDTFDKPETAAIVLISQPDNGEVEINPDNTLKFIPSTFESTVETFTYTVQFENEEGSISTETGAVTVQIVVNVSPFEYCQDGNPIGGGAGYDAILTTGTHIVSTNLSTSDFKSLVEARTSGDVVFIQTGVTLDLTSLGSDSIFVPAGVTIASDRGHNGNEGALIKSDHMAYLGTGSERPVFITAGTDVRFTGFRLQGPYGGAGVYSLDIKDRRRKFGIVSAYNNTEVDNMELYNWPFAAVTFSIYGASGSFYGSPNQFSNGHLYHHNYVHNNRQNSYGYGINVQKADVKIYANRFADNRHDIAAAGSISPNYSGYEAYCNTFEGNNISHNVDMHGNNGREPGTVAGKYAYIHHNDFIDVGAERSSNKGTNNENIRISGNPEELVTVVNNRFAHSNIREAYKILYLNAPANEVVKDNIFTGD